MFHLHPHRQLQIITGVFIVSWIVGTFLIHYFEKAQGWNYFDALYFTVITTATIGFGDLVPLTLAGKILTMVYAIFYVPLFLYVATLMYEGRFRSIRAAEERMARNIREVGADVHAIMEDTAEIMENKAALLDNLTNTEIPVAKTRKRIAKK